MTGKLLSILTFCILSSELGLEASSFESTSRTASVISAAETLDIKRELDRSPEKITYYRHGKDNLSNLSWEEECSVFINLFPELIPDYSIFVNQPISQFYSATRLVPTKFRGEPSIAVEGFQLIDFTNRFSKSIKVRFREHIRSSALIGNNIIYTIDSKSAGLSNSINYSGKSIGQKLYVGKLSENSLMFATSRKYFRYGQNLSELKNHYFEKIKKRLGDSTVNENAASQKKSILLIVGEFKKDGSLPSRELCKGVEGVLVFKQGNLLQQPFTFTVFERKNGSLSNQKPIGIIGELCRQRRAKITESLHGKHVVKLEGIDYPQAFYTWINYFVTLGTDK